MESGIHREKVSWDATDKDIGMKQPSVGPSKSDLNKTNSLPLRPSDLDDYAPAGPNDEKKIDIDKSLTTNTRWKTRSCGNNIERTGRSVKIQSLLPAHGIESKGQNELQCAACDLVINHKVLEHEVVKCTNCTNILHPACSGIQAGWYSHFKFHCSKLEIECRKHIKGNNLGRKRRYSGTVSEKKDVPCNKETKNLHGPAEKGTERSIERPPPPSSIENSSGLTQKMLNLTITKSEAPRTTSNIPKELTKIIPGLIESSIPKWDQWEKNQDSPFTSFGIPNREVLEQILLEISVDSSIVCREGKYGYKSSVTAPDIGVSGHRPPGQNPPGQ